MSKRVLIIIGIIWVLFFSILVLRFSSSEDNWICKDGKWIKHGNPRDEKPDKPCK